MRAHTRFGRSLLENACKRCLCHEFDQNALAYARQVGPPLDYDGVLLDSRYRVDVVVNNEMILELYSGERVLPLHQAQLLTYLHLSRCRIGLLLNFSMRSLRDGIRRRVLTRPGSAAARHSRPNPVNRRRQTRYTSRRKE